MSAFACPSRLLMVTMSTPASINWLACVRRSAWNVTSGIPASSAKSDHAIDTAFDVSGVALNGREQQRIVGEASRADLNAQLKLGFAVIPQGIDQDIGQRDIAPTSAGLGFLEAYAEQIGLFQCRADLNDLGVEIDVIPAQRQHLA